MRNITLLTNLAEILQRFSIRTIKNLLLLFKYNVRVTRQRNLPLFKKCI